MAVLIIFPVILQTAINLIMLSIGGLGHLPQICPWHVVTTMLYQRKLAVPWVKKTGQQEVEIF